MLSESYVIGPETPAVENKAIGQSLKQAADECPDRIGLIAGVSDIRDRREFTYAQMYADALIAAHALLKHVVPGERVAVMAPNIPEWVLLEYASALAGTVLVTVNPSYQAEEIAYVLKQSGSSAIFVLPSYRGNQILASVQQIASNCPALKHIFRFDQWDKFMATGVFSTAILPDVKPDDVTMIQYTSGTTGFPKGVQLHHRGLVNNGAHVSELMENQDGEVSIVMVPLFHTSGCVLGVLGAVAKKLTMVLMEAFEPGLVLELIESYAVNTTGGVPAMLVSMLEHTEFASRDLSSLSKLSAGGSTVPVELVKRFERELGAKFIIVFGQTECSPVASMTRPDDSLEDKSNTIGSPMPNVEIKIVEPETDEIVALNTLGEYCTRGYHVMHGYYRMPEATTKAIDCDGWLHTGDLCSMDERGYCKIEGRLKDMIIRGGENIYPKEIENLLFQHTSVSEAAVVGLPDEQMGEVVGAFVRPAPGEQVDKDDLFAYLREHLSPQKTPKHWFVVDEFPLTGSGKVQKFALCKKWQAGEFEEL